MEYEYFKCNMFSGYLGMRISRTSKQQLLNAMQKADLSTVLKQKNKFGSFGGYRS
jgi:hypothetical protein